MKPKPPPPFYNGVRMVRYFCGLASWHQARAGHSCSSILVARHTHAEHLAYLATARPDYPISSIFES